MKSIADKYPGSYVREIVSGFTPGWSTHNPSIAQGPDGEYRCIVRSANYVYRNGNFIPVSYDRIVRTRNYLCDMDDHLVIQSIDLIDDSEFDNPVPTAHIRNVEDARLFWHKDSWYTSGTFLQHRTDAVPKIVLDRLEGSRVVDRRILKNDDDSVEKNWMPILGSDPIRWVYSVYPAYVVDEFNNFHHRDGGVYPSGLRGSSQLIPFDDGYLAVTHEVTFEPTRHYWHRFVKFDQFGFATSVSDAFYFLAPGIEFANGVALWRDNVVVSFGNNEERALLAVIPAELV